MISLSTEHLKGFVTADELERIFPSVREAHDKLHKAKGLGAEFT